eukprot:2134504-Prymnesium_polylepis.1
MRVGCLLFVLVISSSYTANLAAFFTRSDLRLVGPLTPKAMQSAIACVVDPDTAQMIEAQVAGVITAPGEIMAEGVLSAVKWCSDRLAEGSVEVVAANLPMLAEFLSRSNGCYNMSLINALSTSPTALGYSFSRPRLPADFGLQVSAWLAELVRTPWYRSRAGEVLYENFYCPGEGPEDSVGETTAVRLDQ